ncbi:MAG: hypothetical protein EOO46_09715 [Flavobacterium sp.]|nr:MAG: hypothetical protein EOO46_09715 [Flavobacterium sp.]
MKINNVFLQILLLVSFSSLAQDIPSEFSSKYIPNKKGGEVIYCGNDKHFLVKFNGKKVEHTEIEGGTNPLNQHFIAVDGKVIQSSIIPIPQNVLDSYDLNNLSLEQQESILTGYMNYELEYIAKEMELGITEIRMKAETHGSKSYIFWRYNIGNYKDSEDPKVELAKGQIYLSIMCFNQILTLNMPFLKDYSLNDLTKALTKIVKTLEIKNISCTQ